MPSGIDLFRLYAIINRKLRTRQDSNTELEVSPQLIVVLDAGTLLTDPKFVQVAASLTAAAGTYVIYHTVPDLKRWRVHRLRRDATAGNTSMMALLAGGTVRRLSAADGTAAEATEVDWPMDAGDTLGLLTTGNAGDSSIGMAVLYEEEDMVRGA